MTNIDRRRFITVSGIAAGAPAICSSVAFASQTAPDAVASRSSPSVVTGNGEWTYEVVPGWGLLPPGTNFGGTHGAIAQDKAGNIYVSTQSATGVLVYSREGKLLRTIANLYPEIHSMVYANEGSEEFLYATVQKGTPQENWLFV